MLKALSSKAISITHSWSETSCTTRCPSLNLHDDRVRGLQIQLDKVCKLVVGVEEQSVGLEGTESKMEGPGQDGIVRGVKVHKGRVLLEVYCVLPLVCKRECSHEIKLNMETFIAYY